MMEWRLGDITATIKVISVQYRDLAVCAEKRSILLRKALCGIYILKY
jgi:hypothetical protein